MNSSSFREVSKQESKSVTIQYDQSEQVWIIWKLKISQIKEMLKSFDFVLY